MIAIFGFMPRRTAGRMPAYSSALALDGCDRRFMTLAACARPRFEAARLGLRCVLQALELHARLRCLGRRELRLREHDIHQLLHRREAARCFGEPSALLVVS